MSEQLLREIADRQAITDIVHRYGRAMDRMDLELGYSVWHDDGTADYGAVYQGSGRGFVDAAWQMHQHLVVTQHMIGNILIHLDGDRAGSESYFHGSMRMQGPDGFQHMAAWGRYVDRWSRREGRWAIDHRIAIIDFDEVRDVTPLGNAGGGSRDPGDRSYQALAGYFPAARPAEPDVGARPSTVTVGHGPSASTRASMP